MEVEYPLDKTIQLLFEEQVERTPDSIALVFEDQQLTYRELNNRANQLAHYLRDIYKTNYYAPLPPDTLIALCIERSLEMVIAILAILKAGAAYVPLEPNYPHDRLQHMLQDIQTPLLVTQSTLLNHLPLYDGSILCLDDVQEIFSSANLANPNIATQPNNLAYIIYTSGSTGKPKGVMVEHSSIYNVVMWGINHMPVLSGQKLLHTNSYSFDASIYNLFQPLACGATILLVSYENRFNLNHLVNLIIKHQISHIKGTPSVVINLLDHPKLINNPQITDIICGAEPFSIELFKKVKNVKGRKVYNLYGPTETAVFSTYYQANKSYTTAHNNCLPIGLPIANTQLYVVDCDDSLCCVGVTGELYIGGGGLARGYLNRPELTAEKFITNPFASKEEKKQGKNSRLYRTGDLARWLPDGNLEYLGRIDQQVKIRGIRIECGEIEQALLTHPLLKQAIVTGHELETGKILVAYYTKEKEAAIRQEALRKHLSKSLPEYMIPSVFMSLESFPLTNNGKLDQKALPKPDQSMIRSEIGYTAPRNIVEEKLSEIWSIVLKRDKIGIYDNFFMIGGHSLLATQVISRINQAFGYQCSVKFFFNYPTIVVLAAYINKQQEIIIFEPRVKITSIADRYRPLELSFAQERLWFIDKFNEGETASYNIPTALHLKGFIDKAALEASIQDIIDRHESLRTAFIDIDGVGGQLIFPEMKLAITRYDVSKLKQEEIERIVNEEATKRFDLSKGPLIRVQILILGEEEHILLLTMHHIVSDGWSMGIFFEELSLCYQARLEGKVPDLPVLAIQYADFAQWQKNWLQGDILERQLDYWKKSLAGYENLNLPLDYPRPAQQSFAGSHYVFKIPGQLSRSLQQLAQQYQGTLFTVLLSAFNVLLSRYSGQTDIVIGTPIANRHLPEVEKLIGFFVNTLAIRTKFSLQDTFSDLLLSVTQEALEAYEHQDVPFEKLVDALQIERDLSRSPIFQVMLVLQNANDTPGLSLAEVEISRAKQSYNVAKFDLTLTLRETEDGLVGAIEYNTELFKEATIARLSENFKVLLAGIVENPQQAICQLPVLTEKEKKQILIDWNKTGHEYPADKTIHQLFEEQVERTPDSIALVFEDHQLTYRELNKRANQLAHYITACYESKFQHPVKPDTLIALCIDRGLDLVLAILAILKAGAAYVPIDPSNPDDRIQFLINDVQAKFILTDKNNSSKIPICTARVLVLNDGWQKSDQYLVNNPITIASTHSLAYVIYTSGTTGNPKGVMVEHQGVINTLISQFDYLDLNNKLGDLITCGFFTNYAFDASVAIIFLPLISGYKLVISKELSVMDMTEISNFIKRNQINFINCAQILNLLNDDISSLKCLITGGEKPDKNVVENLLSRGISIYQEYGLTESSIVSTYKKLEAKDDISKIGLPIYNTKCYVLDQNLTPLPIGAKGELYISGVGLARGYLNQPHFTEERFINNPFQTEEDQLQGKNTKLYKTGDLVRWLPDGDLEYIGRNDFQVKIRGYRVELVEIETVLSSYEGIIRSAIIDKEHLNAQGEPTHNKYLVGYYVAKSRIDEDKLLNYLNSKLPDYMVPTALVHLYELPVNINGKLDRKALPAPCLVNKDEYLAPRNDLEVKICHIWADILELDKDKLGIRDDFFRLGGNSILAIKLVSRLNKQLNSNISVSLIFKYNTIERLAHHLKDHSEENVKIHSTEIIEKEKQLLSFAQERLWFIDKYEEGTNAYNISMIFNLKDTIKLDILEKSIRGIVSRHEVLRTLIKYNNDDQAYQLVLDDKDYPLNIVRVRINSREELDQELTRQVNYIFNLGNEYPIRVVIYQLHNKAEAGLSKYVLSILIHHIAFDGWSIDIFLKELEAHYHYYLSQSQGLTCTLNLPKLEIQYKDYALWQRNYLTGERLNNQISYWKNKLTGFEKLDLYIDKLRPAQINYLGKEVHFDLNESISIILRELAKEFKVSLYSLLLAGYYLTLSVYSNQNDIIIGTPIANRQYSQIEHLIGFFINSLALRTKHNPNYTIKEFIQMVGNEVVEAHAHQDLPFEKLVEELNIEKDITHHPIFDVWFEVQSFGGELYKQSSIENSLTNILEPYRAKFNLHKVAKFDLSVFIEDRGNKLRGIFNYAESLYKEETIERFVNTYKTILTQIANVLTDQQTKQNFRIKELTYLTKQEQNLILNIWNNTSALYPQNKTINQLFEEQVERSPNDIAVMCIKNWEENGEQEEIKLTYKELNKKVNRLAHYLINKGVRNDTLVIVALERSIDAIITFLAVLKAGGAYVPINPQEPQARIEHIFNDTKAPIIITNTTYADSLQSTFAQVICLDKILTEISNLSHINFQIKDLKPTNLAYVIYTSGTSGKPKGVMIEHRGVINYTENVARYINIGIADKVDCSTNIGFDLTVTTTICSLLLGASVVLYNGDVKDIESYKNHLCMNNINVVKLVPSYFELIAEFLPQTQIKKIILGGEKLDGSIVRKVLDIYKSSNLNKCSLEIYDEYGPTETTVGSCISKVMVDVNDNISLNIGKAYRNYTIYVLSPSSFSLLPIGAIGELYIGGVGLARGYLNNPELTSEKFIANPFQTEKEKEDIEGYGPFGRNARLYKTGDLARWLPDGNLEYIGRIDQQVKIRGYRIECGEIEQALLKHPKIKQAIITDYQSEKGKQLVAYFIEQQGSNLTTEELRKHLSQTLPEYMIPSVFIRLDSLPLTNNGKLDRKALPDPEFGGNKDSYIPPRNELEQKICQIWAEILGLDAKKISIYDDFFNLGGNSILAIKLVNKTNNYFKSHIKVSDIFVYKNIESLSARIAQTKSDYQTVVKLNNTYDKTNIFMIHPGGGGCEQYTSLANLLVNDFSCYGIDPYNIYNKNKIDNLHELSKHYLSHLDQIMAKTKQEIYHLFGWSFGGKIALEIACILEKRGCTKIKVYLLDSFINDDYTISLMGNIDIEKRKSLYRNYLALLGYESPYIERAILNYDIEYQMTHKQKVSSLLKNTEILLFKATLRHANDEIDSEEIKKYQEYMITLEFNNIDKIHKNLNNIQLIKVNAYHENMLDLRKLIASKIIGKDLDHI